MDKSFNQIKAQEQRVIAYAAATGRWSDNAKKRTDTQRIALITRRTLTQHGFPIFGNFDKDEPRPCIYHTETKPDPVQEVQLIPANTIQPTPTEKADERMALQDWIAADSANRKRIQEIARHQFMNRMYAELLFDMQVCKIEGWDVLEYPRTLRDAIDRIIPKQGVQLSLF